MLRIKGQLRLQQVKDNLAKTICVDATYVGATRVCRCVMCRAGTYQLEYLPTQVYYATQMSEL